MKQKNNYLFPNNNDEESLERYFNEIKKYPLLSADEEARLARKAQNGDQRALDKLVCSNLRFVVSNAIKYYDHRVSLGDLICEGNIGLVMAAQRFDASKGNKFITYAVFWIQKKIFEALAEQGCIVRLPQNKLSDLKQIYKAEEELYNLLHRQPTLDEIAEATNLSLKRVAELRRLDVTGGLPIDTHADKDDDYFQEDLFLEDTRDRADKFVMIQSLVSDIHRALCKLPDTEEAVLRLLYGIGTSHEHSLEEVGIILGIPRERVRQLRNRAIKRLYNYDKSNDLGQYLAA